VGIWIGLGWPRIETGGGRLDNGNVQYHTRMFSLTEPKGKKVQQQLRMVPCAAPSAQ